MFLVTVGHLLISSAALTMVSPSSTSDAVRTPSASLRGALAHPLPAGMRDLLPEQAEVQHALLAQVLESYSRYGYQRVTLPAFEYAEVLEQGLGAIDPNSIVRFVEPETGEVVALRPDMTPQVARLVATRLADAPSPQRLCYRGSVVRRRHERARHDQQTLQVGIELVGDERYQADLEVILATIEAVQASGLEKFVLDLGHGALAPSLLSGVEEETRSALIESLSLKDKAELAKRGKAAGVESSVLAALLGLIDLQGGGEVFEQAAKLLNGFDAARYLEELRTLHQALLEHGVKCDIVVDLAETKAVAYYTGPVFQILAEGPGQAVASGGRYDGLYGRFGAERPACGAGIQVDHLAWALGKASEKKKVAVLVVSEDFGRANSAAMELRSAGLTTAILNFSSQDRSSLLDYARYWRYSHVVLEPSGGKTAASDWELIEVSSEEEGKGRFSLDEVQQRLLPV
ncbi:MAG: ATP phosphoribosyltransferase regulatory subunit [Polyangiaceae bacterium]|nr:ATP phosphoribosyltransferase regulatory subunit [Polyangiaceae bacterium]